MSDMTIEQATPDTDVTGIELLPISDGGVAKSVTINNIKDFVVAKLAVLASTSTIDSSGDKVFVINSSGVKIANSSLLADTILNYGFAKTGVVSINGNEIIGVKDSVNAKTITVNSLKAWLESNLNIEAAIDIHSLDPAGAVSTTDELIVYQSANKKLTMANLGAWVHGAFAAFVNNLSASSNVAGTDVVYIVQGGDARKTTISALLALAPNGDVHGPTTTTENKVPQWDATNKTLKDGVEIANSISSSPVGTKLATEGAVRTAIDLKGDVSAVSTTTTGNIPVWGSTAKTLADGLSVQTTVRANGTAADTAIATEKAVRDAMIAANGVGAPASTSPGYVPQWSETQKTLAGGVPLVTTVRGSAVATDSAIPTEQAVRECVDGLVAMPVSHTEDCVPTWGAGSELKAGKAVVTTISSSGSDDNLPTEKAVRDALPVVATPSTNGLMSAADKTKLDGLADTGSVAEIGAPLADADTVIVKQTDVLYKKSLLSRFWTYILSKLPTVGIDTLGATTDVTTLNASTTAHGLCPKLSGSASQFLDGTGAFTTPSGMTDFVGTDGTTAGTHGLVPAPATTDVNKFLNADGTWATPPSAAGVDIPGATAIDALADADLVYAYDASASSYRKVTGSQILNYVDSKVRYDNLFIPAGAMTPSNVSGSTPGAITFNNTTHDTQAFGNTADVSAEFSVVFPDDWDKLTLKFKAIWTVYDSTHSETGQHVKFTIGGISYADGESITVAPTTYVDLTDQVDSANEMHKTAASTALTLDGTVANNNLVHFRVTRDADYAPTGGTALPTEALLLGIVVQFGRTSNRVSW